MYESFWHCILSRQIALEDSLDVSALAEELDTLPATAVPRGDQAGHRWPACPRSGPRLRRQAGDAGKFRAGL